jgi:hypothetical protein
MDIATHLIEKKSLDNVENTSFSSATNRFIIEAAKLIAKGKTSNTGIACYICEFICKNSNLLNSYPTIPDRCLEHIIQESVEINGRSYWRWEAAPIRDDYHYPIDWDDTCKGIDAIIAYKNAFSLDPPILLPKITDLIELLYASVFVSKEAGEDVKIPCKNDLAMYMFIADLNKKPNNTEDIFVTTATLRTFLITLQVRDQKFLSLANSLLYRVFNVAEWGISNRIPMSFISRCYLSWSFLLHLLQDISIALPKYFSRCNKLIAAYFENEIFKLLFEKKLRPFLIRDELSHALILARRGIPNESTIQHDLLKEIILSNKLKSSLLYRHRRLDHYYGSEYWSGLLREIATERMY